jgi:hypothetical protein
VDRPETSTTLEDALRSELRSGPSPAAVAAIDRRVSAALAEPSDVSARTTHRLRRFAVAPVVALAAALVLGTVIATEALVLTAEDQRVIDRTACMRERGWDVADANVEGGTGHVVPGFSTIVDESQQQAFNADLETCATNAGIPIER